MSEEAETKAFDKWCPWGKLTQVRKGAKAAWAQLYPEIAVRDSIIKAHLVELQRSSEALKMEKHLRRLAVVELEELRPLKDEQIESMQKNTLAIIAKRREMEAKIQKMRDQIERLLTLLNEVVISPAKTSEIEFETWWRSTDNKPLLTTKLAAKAAWKESRMVIMETLANES